MNQSSDHTQLRRYVHWLAGDAAFREIVAAAGFDVCHFDANRTPNASDIAVLERKVSLRLGFTPAALRREVTIWASGCADQR